MLALVKTGPQKGVCVREAARPKTGKDEVLVKVHACGICGSDVHIYNWTDGYAWMDDYMPLALGHEFSGTVEEMGAEVTSVKMGDKVVVYPAIGCGICEMCQKGLATICPQVVLSGFHTEGAFADYISVKAFNCIKLPKDADLDIAALTEPLALAQRAVSKANELVGKKVAVIGAGIVGLATTYFASIEHAAVWVFGQKSDMTKKEIAEKFGAVDMIDTGVTSLTKSCAKITDGQGFDVVFDCTGSPRVLEEAMAVIKNSGAVITYGIYPSPLTLDVNSMIRKDKSLITTYAYSFQGFEYVAKRIQEYPELFANLISRKFSLDQGEEAMEYAAKGGKIKVLINPGEQNESRKDGNLL